MTLKQSFLNMSITKKLVLINFIVVITALSITCASIMLVQSAQMKTVIIKEMQTQADVISYNVAAAISFGDPTEAGNILASLSKVSKVDGAAVFDADGNLFARYERAPGGSVNTLIMPQALTVPDGPSYFLRDRYLHLAQVVTVGEDNIGHLYLLVSMDELYSLRHKTIFIIALALGGSLLISLAIIFRLQSIISKPILHLSETTKQISTDKAYSLRASKTSSDELGVLIDGFNEMLENIEKRDEMLSAHKLHLENVVLRRTQDLENSNIELQETVRALREASKTLQISEENKRIAEESAKTKARFLANMSHELRTPMNGVLGMLNLLSESALQEDQAEYTTLALDSAGVLLATLDEILDITKIEAGKLTIENAPFDVFQVVDEVFGMLGEAAFNKGVELAWYKTDDVSQCVVGDSHRTKQVLYNLVNNAIKFTDSGHVLLHISREVLTSSTLNPPMADAMYVLRVSDTGLGIQPEAQSRIFESFTQADDSTTRRFGGTGLGLALCKELTQLMGGGISLESTYGEGSTFTAKLLVGIPDEQLMHREREHYERIRGVINNGISEVLVLEDKAVGESVLETQFAQLGVKYRSARSLQEYLSLLCQVINKDTLLLIDLSLPGLDPDAVISAIAVRLPMVELRIIAMGCLAQRQQLSSVNRKRLSGQLSKPLKYNAIESGLLALVSPDGASQHVSLNAHRETVKTEETLNTDDSKKRILVVEDNLVNQKVIVGRLTRLGYLVETADNGARALTMLKNADYDLVFMDCQMPIMDGYETTRCIREVAEWEHLPVIALTANALPGDREKCLSAGMDDYLIKPVNSDNLMNRLNIWLHGGNGSASESQRQTPKA